MAARGGHGPHSCILLGLWEMVSTDSFHLALSTDDLVADQLRHEASYPLSEGAG
jgi:hypothetical protein